MTFDDTSRFNNPSKDWVMVELFRHQYGNLPGSDDMRTVDIEEATKKMAIRVDQGEVSTFNAAIVIAWLGKNIK